jgi:hypothetical protein
MKDEQKGYNMPSSGAGASNRQDNLRDEDTQPSQSASNQETPIYVTDDATLQTPEEDRHDKSIDTRQDTSREPSMDDLHETSNDRLAGSDRAGTFERKDNSMSPKEEE